jgi:hypothetical protein
MTGRMGGSTVRRRWILLAVAAAIAITFGSTYAQRSWTGPSPDATPPTPYTGPKVATPSCLAVGAAVNSPGPDRHNSALFRKANAEIGPLTVRRSFDSSMPSDFESSAGGSDSAVGVHSFVSWKPPGGDFRGAAHGKYDDQVIAWARSVPHNGVYATAYHEPENDMTAAQFVALQRHLYTVVKNANPTIHWGPVYMAYWWDPGSPDHYVGNPAAWWPGKGFADFAALDWYGPDPTPMSQSPSFQNWYATMLPTGLPLLITEYGQYVIGQGELPDPAKEAARVQAIEADAAWIEQHKRIRMWLYWDGTGAQGDWRLHDKASQQAWRTVAEAGCRS